MGSAVFRVITQRIVVICYQRSGQHIGSVFKVRKIGWPEMYVIATMCCVITQKNAALHYLSNQFVNYPFLLEINKEKV